MMSTASNSPASKIPAANLAEAGVWLAKLKGPSRDENLEDSFRTWLAASPMNAQAFEATTDVWQEAAGLNRMMPLTSPRRGFSSPSRTLLAVGLLAAAFVAFGLWLLQPRGIETAVGEQRTLNLEDGTRLTLNTATRVVINYDRSARKIELKRGEALFDVAQRPDRPFIVTVQNHEVRALGTSFVVRRDPDHLDVMLIDGKVSVAPEGSADQVILKPGERLSLAATGAPRIDRPQLDAALAWRRGQVVLDDTPLSLAVAEINRYSSVEVSIERPEAKQILVNGLFQAGDSRSFAEAVALTYGLRVVSQEGRLVLSGIPHH